MLKPERTEGMSDLEWIDAQLDYYYWRMEFISSRRAYLRTQMAEFHNEEERVDKTIGRLEREKLMSYEPIPIGLLDKNGRFVSIEDNAN